MSAIGSLGGVGFPLISEARSKKEPAVQKAEETRVVARPEPDTGDQVALTGLAREQAARLLLPAEKRANIALAAGTGATGRGLNVLA